MSNPLFDDSDLTLIMNKEKIKPTEQTSSQPTINISKEESNPFSIDSSNPIINSFEKSDETIKIETNVTPSTSSAPSVPSTSSDTIFKQSNENSPTIKVDSFNTSSSNESYQHRSNDSHSSHKEFNFEQERNEKAHLLNKFDKLRRMGIHIPQEFNFSSDVEMMRHEYDKIKNQRELENSIKFQRKMLMACITGIEFLNNRFDPFDVKLNGWSESVHENVNDYNEVFEELHEKYHTKTQMAPELKLLFMLGGSAFMFHLTNSMFKSQLPGLGDIMKQNPDLMRQFASAAMGSMGTNGPDMTSMFMGPSSSNNHTAPPSSSKVNTPSAKKFTPPTGIDELLNSLHSDNTNTPSGENITLNMN
jgi:hypothetical protein